MKPTTQLLGAVSAVALVAMTSAPAMAEGIEAGTIVTNTVNVDYQVGGVDQTQITATDQFAVDRRIDVVVDFVGTTGGDSAAAPFEVAPGQTAVALQYDVTNLSNTAVDFDLNAAILNDVGPNATIIQVFEDTNSDNALDGGETVDYMANMAADETRRVVVLVSVDAGAQDTEGFEVHLNANAHEAGSMSAGGTGDEIVESSADSSDPLTVDTALVDDDSGFELDDDRDGSDTDRSFVEVSAANVSVVKSSVVVSDPVNGTTNPKAIPGAVIRYCIAVTNAGSGADAENIVINDALPGEVDFNTGTIERNVTASVGSGGATCTAGTGAGATDSTSDTDGGGYDSGTNTVAGTIDDVVAGDTTGFTFTVTIAPPQDGVTTASVTATRDTDAPN